MIKEKVILTNLTGLNVKAADSFCRTAMQFQSKITFQVGNTTANAKRVLGILGADVRAGDQIEFICEGLDEGDALKAMVELVNSGLDE